MDDLTPNEIATARERGWGLYYVFDQKVERWSRAILPTDIEAAKHAQVAALQVINTAKMNDQLSIKALRLMSQFNTRTQ
jgi:hypothetical protein